MCMENLVRRLGRIISLTKKKDDWTSRRMERLERALELWQKNKGWRKPVRTVGEVAESLGTDTGVLHCYFKERVGMDFRTWRTHLRLEDAKRMLLERPDLQASEIARRVGFSDRSNFSRQFLAYTGFTPGRWRERGRE